MKKNRVLLLASILAACVLATNAQDWPQFMGPNRNGTSPQKNLLHSWPSGGPEIIWKTDVGIGYGGPVIKDGKAYLLDRDDKAGDFLRCLDMSNGKELWRFAYDAPGSVMFPGSRSVPVIDGNYVYTCGPYGDLYCVDINTHKPVWNKNVWTDYGGKPGGGSGGGFSREPGGFPTWAISQCPMIYGDLLIIASQAPQAGVVAYNKISGKEVWKTPSLGETGYVSPNLIKISGEDQVVMISAAKAGGFGQGISDPGKVVGIKPLTGEILWEYNDYGNHLPISMAVDAGDNKILVAGGYELGVVMLKVDKKADGSFEVTELFKHTDFGDHTKPPIVYKNYIYGQYSTNDKRDGLTCMSMDGKIMWKTERDPAFDKGSMILVGDVILATDGTLKLYLFEPNPDEFKPIATAELFQEAEGGGDPMAARFGGSTQNWAPLALANGKLLIRDQNNLLCVKVAE